MKFFLRILFAPLVLLMGCTTSTKINLPFDFNNPAEIIKLPQKLHEISGITFYLKNEMACVEDEKGVIFFYDIRKDKLRDSLPFAKNKDYEGIANVNDTLYVLCSNGEISEVDINKNESTKTYKTFLSKDNNCEGLCYDSDSHRLLVACKGKPKKKTAKHGMKAIYSFDLITKEMSREPAFVINPDSVLRFINANQEESFIPKIFHDRSADENFLFEPSELCIDPLTKDIYILSSVGKTLLSISKEGKINFAIHLDPDIFKQPEGITFSKDNVLFISDEGRGGKANLIKLKRLLQ